MIGRNPNEEFRGFYVESGLSPTRKNVLAPGSVGVYAGGSNYNPAQVLRDDSILKNMDRINAKLEKIPDKGVAEMSIKEIQELISLINVDESESERVWNPIAVAESIGQFAELKEQRTGFVYVDRERGLEQRRRETQGILEGGEYAAVPDNKIALFMLRTKGTRGSNPAWWPQIRFPNGQYAFAFAI